MLKFTLLHRLFFRHPFLHVFHTRYGDAPERILLSTLNVTGSEENWQYITEEEEILRPELEWEGANLDLIESKQGPSKKQANQFRDPFVYTEIDDLTGREEIYLYYVGGGESGVGVAKLENTTE